MIYGLTLVKDETSSTACGRSPFPKGEGQEGASSLPSPLGEGGTALAVTDEVRSLRAEVAELRAMLVAQNALLEQVAQSLAQTRVSRSQEAALRRAVRDRAAFLCDREDFSMAEHRKVSGAILVTVRQLTGCRALGDVPAVKFDQVMTAISAWDMPGALRKIRRRCEA